MPPVLSMVAEAVELDGVCMVLKGVILTSRGVSSKEVKCLQLRGKKQELKEAHVQVFCSRMSGLEDG